MRQAGRWWAYTLKVPGPTWAFVVTVSPALPDDTSIEVVLASLGAVLE